MTSKHRVFIILFEGKLKSRVFIRIFKSGINMTIRKVNADSRYTLNQRDKKFYLYLFSFKRQGPTVLHRLAMK